MWNEDNLGGRCKLFFDHEDATIWSDVVVAAEAVDVIIKPLIFTRCGELGKIHALGLEVSRRHRKSVTHPKNSASPIDP